MSPPSWCPPSVGIPVYVFWSIMFCQTVLLILFSVNFMKKLFQSQDIKCVFKTLCTIVCALFIASCIGICIHLGQSVFCSSPGDWLITLYIGGLPYIFGLAVLYLLYLYRVKVTFHGTRFGLSRGLFIGFWIGFILQLSFEPLWFFLYLLRINGLSLDTDWTSAVLAYVASIVTNFIFNVLLLIVFMRKVFALIRCTSKEHRKQAEYNSKSDSDDIDARRLQMLLYPAIRYMICALFTMVSSNLLTFLGLIRSFFITDTMTIYAFNLTLIMSDQLVNLFFLNLQFSFNDKRYSMCCSRCHLGIYNGIVSRIAPEKFNMSKSLETLTLKTETSQLERTTNTTGTGTSCTIDGSGTEPVRMESTVDITNI